MNLWRLFGDKVKGSSIPRADEVAKNTDRIRKLALQGRQSRAGADRVTELPDGKTATTLGGPIKRPEAPKSSREEVEDLITEGSQIAQAEKKARSGTAAALDAERKAKQGPAQDLRAEREAVEYWKEKLAEAERAGDDDGADRAEKALRQAAMAMSDTNAQITGVERISQKQQRSAQGALEKSVDETTRAELGPTVDDRKSTRETDPQYRLSEKIKSSSKRQISIRRAIEALRGKPSGMQGKVKARSDKIKAGRAADAEQARMSGVVVDDTPLPAFASEFKRKIEESLTPKIGEDGQTYFDTLKAETEARETIRSLGIRQSSPGMVGGIKKRLKGIADTVRDAAEFSGLPVGRPDELPDARIDKDALYTTQDIGGTTSYPADANEQLATLRRRYGLDDSASIEDVTANIAAEKMGIYDANRRTERPTGPSGQPIQRESSEPDFRPTLEDDASRVFNPEDQPVRVKVRDEVATPKYKRTTLQAAPGGLPRNNELENLRKQREVLLRGGPSETLRVGRKGKIKPATGIRARTLEELDAKIAQLEKLGGSWKSPRTAPGDSGLPRIAVDDAGRPVRQDTGASASVTSKLVAADPSKQTDLNKLWASRNLPGVTEAEKASYDKQIDALLQPIDSSRVVTRKIAAAPSISERVRALIQGRKPEARERLEQTLAPRMKDRYVVDGGEDADDLIVLRQRGTGDDQNIVSDEVIFRRTPNGTYVRYSPGGSSSPRFEVEKQELSESQVGDYLNQGWEVYQQPAGSKLRAPKLNDPAYLAQVAKEFYSTAPGSEGANIRNVQFALSGLDEIRKVRGKAAYMDALEVIGESFGSGGGDRVRRVRAGLKAVRRMRAHVADMTERSELVTARGRKLTNEKANNRPDAPPFSPATKEAPWWDTSGPKTVRRSDIRRSDTADWNQESKDLARQVYKSLLNDGVPHAEAMRMATEAGTGSESLLQGVNQWGDSPEALALASRALSDARVASDPRESATIMAQASREAGEIAARDRAAVGTAVDRYGANQKFWSTPTGQRARELYAKEVKVLDANRAKGKLTDEEYQADLRDWHKASIAKAISEYEEAVVAQGGEAVASTVTPESVVRKFYRNGTTPDEGVARAAVDNFARRFATGKLDMEDPEVLQFQQNHSQEIESALNFMATPEGEAMLGRAPLAGGDRVNELTTDDSMRASAMARIVQSNDRAKAFSRANVQRNARKIPNEVHPLERNIDEEVDFAGNTTLEPLTLNEQKLEVASERVAKDARIKLADAEQAVEDASIANGKATNEGILGRAFEARMRLEDAVRRRDELRAQLTRPVRPDDVRDKATAAAQKALDQTSGPQPSYIPVSQIRAAASKVAANMKARAVQSATEQLANARRSGDATAVAEAERGLAQAQSMSVQAPVLFKANESRTASSRIPNSLEGLNAQVAAAEDKVRRASGADKKAAEKELRSLISKYRRVVGGDSQKVGKSSAEAFDDLAANLIDPAKPGELTAETQRARFNAMLAPRTKATVGAAGEQSGGAADQSMDEVAAQKRAILSEQLGGGPPTPSGPSRRSFEDTPHRFLSELAAELGLDPSSQDDVGRLVASALHGNTAGRYSPSQVSDFSERANQFLVDAGMFKSAPAGAQRSVGAVDQSIPHPLDPLYGRLLSDEKIASMSPEEAAAELAANRRRMDALNKARLFKNPPTIRSQREEFLLAQQDLDDIISEITGQPKRQLDFQYTGEPDAIEKPLVLDDADDLLDKMRRQEQLLIRRSPKTVAPQELSGNPEDEIRDIDLKGLDRTAMAEEAAARATPASARSTENPVLLSQEGIRPYVGSGPGAINRSLPDGADVLTVAFTPEQARIMAQAGLQGDVFSARGLRPDSGLNTIPAPAEPGVRIAHRMESENVTLPNNQQARRQIVSFDVARKYQGNGISADPMVSGSGLLVENGQVPATHSVIADYDPVSKKFLGFYQLPDTDTIERSKELAGGLSSAYVGGEDLPLGFNPNRRGVPHIVLPQRPAPSPTGQSLPADGMTFDGGNIDNMPAGPQVSGDMDLSGQAAAIDQPRQGTFVSPRIRRRPPGDARPANELEGLVITEQGRANSAEAQRQIDAAANMRGAAIEDDGVGPGQPPQAGILSRIGGAVRRNPGRTVTGAGGAAVMYGAANAPQAVVRSAALTALGMMRGGEPSLGEDTNMVAAAPVLPRQAAVLDRIRASRAAPYLTAQNPMPY